VNVIPDPLMDIVNGSRRDTEHDCDYRCLPCISGKNPGYYGQKSSQDCAVRKHLDYRALAGFSHQ
jgi:hypothetical protein